MSKLHKMSGGGTRQEQKPTYHLMPMHGVRRTAQRFQYGALIHGAENWKRSTETPEDALAWCQEAFNHMIEHAFEMSNGIDPETDHLGAIGWAQSILAFVEDKYSCRWIDLCKENGTKRR